MAKIVGDFRGIVAVFAYYSVSHPLYII